MGKAETGEFDYKGARYKLGLHGLYYRWSDVQGEWVVSNMKPGDFTTGERAPRKKYDQTAERRVRMCQSGIVYSGPGI